jgi:hypothetical protein
MKNEAILLAQEALLAVKRGGALQPFLSNFQALDRKWIHALHTDSQKMAFWINCYNAFAAGLLREGKTSLTNRLDRHRFFSAKQLQIAKYNLSLDDIEHGLLRRSKLKWAKGYLSKWLVPSLEKQWRVDKIDVRLHFALNCGAASCPPIRYYETSQLHEQLDEASRAFLETEVRWLKAENELHVPSLFSWYSGDFGGSDGIKRFIMHYRKDIPLNSFKIRYKTYHWQVKT